MKKENRKPIEKLQVGAEEFVNKQDFLEKACKRMEQFIVEWHYYCDEEQAILEEVVRISQGTPSNQKATLALVNQLAENNRLSYLFETFYQELSEHQKNIAEKEQKLKETISKQSQEALKNVEN